MAPSDKTNLTFLNADGEMGRLTREYNWSNSSLGAPETWPYSLRTAVSILLRSSVPMFLWWGKDHIQFYNDAYRPSFGNQGKHPKALGQRGAECWPEIWPIIYPLMRQVLDTGKSVYHEDLLVPIYRNGSIEDVYWTFGYSAVLGDSGDIEGVLVVCTETTQKVMQEKITLKFQNDIKESEQRFRTMAEGSSTLIAVADQNGMPTYVNQAWTTITGWPIEVFTSQQWIDLVHPDDQEKCRSLFAEALRNQTGFSWEFRIRNTNERYTWLLANGVARFGPDQTFVGHVSTCTDITALKQAEAALRQSEQQMRDLVETAPFPIGVYIGPELRIAIANRALLDSWGRTEKVIGLPLAEALPELDAANLQELAQVYSTRIPFKRENFKVSLGPEGHVRTLYFNYSFVPLRRDNGEIYGVMATGADVTALNVAQRQIEENEKNMRNTILKAPVAICIFRGPEYVVEIANERMLELWGKTATEVMHKPIFDGLPEVRNQGFEELLFSVYHEGRSISIQDRPITLPRNGKLSSEYVSFIYEAETDGTGATIGIIAVAMIVTEQVLARQQIEQVVADRTRELADANRRLERSNADLTQFAHIASHDLQEPCAKSAPISRSSNPAWARPLP